MSSKSLLVRLAQWVPFLCSAGVLSYAGVAHAQGVDEFGTYGPPDLSTRESTQNFALEFRVGPYLPRVDSEFSGPNPPFAKYYGSKNRVALGMEFDWLPVVVKDVLRFGPGVGVMYTSIGADAFYADDGSRATGQTTSLRVLPHWVTGVLRLDALAQRTPIPVVFAGKFGFAHALWWTKDQPRNSPAYDGSVGRGRSYGLYYGLGAQLDLSFLDSQRRKRMDAFLGINRIYFYGEIYALELNGFGSGKVMNVGDRSWVLGLAFDL
jgi:hypothetical protein